MPLTSIALAGPFIVKSPVVNSYQQLLCVRNASIHSDNSSSRVTEPSWEKLRGSQNVKLDLLGASLQEHKQSLLESMRRKIWERSGVSETGHSLTTETRSASKFQTRLAASGF